MSGACSRHFRHLFRHSRQIESLGLPLGQEERSAGQLTVPSADCLPPCLSGCIIMGLKIAYPRGSLGKIRGYTKNNRRKLSRATKYSSSLYYTEFCTGRFSIAQPWGPRRPPARLVAAREAKVGSIPTRAHSQSVGKGLRERLQGVVRVGRHGSPVSAACFISFAQIQQPLFF